MSHTASGVTTDYVWDVARGLPVVLQDSDGNTYVYGLDLISVTDDEGDQTYYLHDGLGSTTDLVDGEGDVVDGYTYDVFGALRSQSGASENPWLFTGEQRDGENDLYYLRARYYDPSTGRFLTQDPLWGSAGLPVSQNRYPYVGCNPTNRIDPTGLMWINDGGGGGPSKEGASFENEPDDCPGGKLVPAAKTVPPPCSPGQVCPARPGAGMVCMESRFPSLSGLPNLKDVWSTVMKGLSSECAQGIGMILLGSGSLLVAATGVGELAAAGGLAAYSVGAAATSAAAAGAAAGPNNIVNAITFLPRGFVQVATSCR